MREIYTSPRLENVERVVALMAEHGIDATIANRRAYAGADWKRFSYTAPVNRDAWPQVSITQAEDLPRARRILRDAGIEPAIRFADELAASRNAGDGTRQRRVSMRAKLIVLALIVGLSALIVSGWLR